MFITGDMSMMIGGIELVFAKWGWGFVVVLVAAVVAKILKTEEVEEVVESKESTETI